MDLDYARGGYENFTGTNKAEYFYSNYGSDYFDGGPGIDRLDM
jgi:hypothetical protein